MTHDTETLHPGTEPVKVTIFNVFQLGRNGVLTATGWVGGKLPDTLTYGDGQAALPAGTVVADIDLLDISDAEAGLQGMPVYPDFGNLELTGYAWLLYGLRSGFKHAHEVNAPPVMAPEYVLLKASPAKAAFLQALGFRLVQGEEDGKLRFVGMRDELVTKLGLVNLYTAFRDTLYMAKKLGVVGHRYNPGIKELEDTIAAQKQEAAHPVNGTTADSSLIEVAAVTALLRAGVAQGSVRLRLVNPGAEPIELANITEALMKVDWEAAEHRYYTSADMRYIYNPTNDPDIESERINRGLPTYAEYAEYLHETSFPAMVLELENNAGQPGSVSFFLYAQRGPEGELVLHAA